MQTIPNQSKVIIVGAGIGGIATAARLARQGCQVTVVEKNENSGGRCGRMHLKGYTFDTGATMFLMPEVYAETFAALGERMEDHLDLRRADPTYHLTFPDDSTMQLSPDMHKMLLQMEAMEPGSFEKMLHYLAEGRRIYRLSVANLLGVDFRKLTDFINPRMLALFLQLKATSLHTDYIRRFFKDPRLQMAFTFQDMYMGLSPYQSPATYSLMQYTELGDGLYFPMGGMYSVTEALTRLAEKAGVTFLYSNAVEKILVEDNAATGVQLENGQVLSAGTVVANADLGYVYKNLLPADDPSAGIVDRKEYGCSTIMFYWGLDKQYPGIGLHNLYLHGDYRQSFVDLFDKMTLSDEPNFYIHAPVRLDASMAPAGHDAWYIALPVGRDNHKLKQDWPALQKKARAFVLKRLAELGLPDVESHIQAEVSFIPDSWQRRYNLPFGSTHGLSHKLSQMAYLRPHNRHSRYHNLYFVGASTHPGTGVPTVLISARLAAARVLEDIKN